MHMHQKTTQKHANYISKSCAYKSMYDYAQIAMAVLLSLVNLVFSSCVAHGG